MRAWIVLVFAAVAAWGQTPAQSQRASIARQNTSVARQRATFRTAAPAVPPGRVTVVRPFCPVIAPATVERLVETAAAAHAIAPDIVMEVARQESAFYPCATSSKGAQGLMQLMPATQALLGVTDPFNPQESVMAGARLLKELLTRYNGDLPLALSAYNAGTRRVDAIQAIPPTPETRDYVAKIMGRLAAIGPIE